jgi:hypothetical protein
MSTQQQPKRKFTIKRLSPEEAERSRQRTNRQPQKPAPEQKPPSVDQTQRPAEEKPKAKQTEPLPPKPSDMPEEPTESHLQSTTGGIFLSAGAVLAFLGSALGSGLANEAAVRQTPEKSWWAEVAVPHEQIASLIWTSGGRPYVYHESQWVNLSVSGVLPESTADHEIISVDQWPMVELGELLAQTHLLAGRYMGEPDMYVVAPGALGRWILRRAIALGLDVTVRPSLRFNMHGAKGKGSGVLLMHLKARRRLQDNIPAALVHSLTRLPYVMVAQSFADENLLVDVRCRIPLSSSLVSGMIPDDEIWILGLPETGSFRLMPSGEAVNGHALLDAPDIAILNQTAHSPALLPESQTPDAIPVQLIARSRAKRHVDAILLDETELKWMRPFLMGKAMGQVSFLIPGQDYYLLTAPGGLPGGGLPFGIPLIRIGPGGLYIEMGMDFYPPLPDSARQALFQLNDDSLVAVTKHITCRFNTSNMTPTWSLWIGKAPDVHADVSPQSMRILSHISSQIRLAEIQQAQHPRKDHKPVTRSQRVKLLKQAQKEELKGNLVFAAELLEQAGYPGQAGRLYERATG